MIRHFACKDTEKLWETEKSRRFTQFARVALRKLQMLNAADSLGVLSQVPGNHFEKLEGDRKGQYSIRINDQFRVCFEFREHDAFEVEITD
ncbi:MAG: type II toxin-antitoxin system RelE/ParE family toxin [Verrucomicrobia bacterium]|nr:type II toxin-antitoxin system RelE/ParE family toxin [Verrucomicrobiota bacterium]